MPTCPNVVFFENLGLTIKAAVLKLVFLLKISLYMTVFLNIFFWGFQDVFSLLIYFLSSQSNTREEEQNARESIPSKRESSKHDSVKLKRLKNTEVCKWEAEHVFSLIF